MLSTARSFFPLFVVWLKRVSEKMRSLFHLITKIMKANVFMPSAGFFGCLGMVNNTSIDWYMPWPEQALYAVASVFISPDVSFYVPTIYVAIQNRLITMFILRQTWICRAETSYYLSLAVFQKLKNCERNSKRMHDYICIWNPCEEDMLQLYAYMKIYLL